MSDVFERVPRAQKLLEQGIEQGLHIGAQLYASVSGSPVVDGAVGEARAGQPLRSDSLMLWMSAVKPLMSVAILQLRERGLLELSDPVCAHLPEFGQKGKDAITLLHVLTHTGGFRGADPMWSNAPAEEIVAGICAAEPDAGAVPGQSSAYHVAAAWYVLAAVVRRLDGRAYGEYVREEVLAPIGSHDVWVGMPAEAHRACRERIAPMHDTSGEAPKPFAFDPFSGSVTGCAIFRPGGAGWGPIRELAWLYEALLQGGERGGRILSPESVALMTTRHTTGLLDESFGVVLERGLGLVIDSKCIAGGGNWFGERCSTASFGHGGFGISVGFADPGYELALGLVFNGMLEHERHEERMRAVIDAVYDDLGLG